MLNSIIRKNIVFLFLSLFVTPINAQYNIGLRSGVNFAHGHSKRGNQISEDKMTGFAFSLYLDLRVGKDIALQPELNFIQKGFTRWSRDYVLNYVEFPLLFKYKFIRKIKGKKAIKRLSGFLLFGPYYGRSKYGIEKESGKKIRDFDFDSSSVSLHHNDLGFLYGGGIVLRLNTGSLLVDLRHSRGLRDLTRGNPAYGALYHRGIIISVGYIIKLKPK